MQTIAMEPAKATRNNLVQIFRALAIIGVVMIHTTPAGEWQMLCRPFINFSVATFLFLSGYLTKTKNEDWGAFMKKRIVRVIVPYLIWSFLYSVQKLEYLPMMLLVGTVAPQMYFIIVYIQFVLLTPLLGKLATSRYQALGWFVAPVSALVFKYFWLLTNQQPNDYVSLFWTDACLGWFTYYYLGLILGNRVMERRYSLKVLGILYLVSIVVQMAEGYGWQMLGEAGCGTQLKLSSFLTSTIFLLIIHTLLQDGRFDIKSRFLRMLGDYSFGVFLCHMLVLDALVEFVPFYESIPYPLNALVVVLVSLLFCYIIDRLCGERVSRWLGIR